MAKKLKKLKLFIALSNFQNIINVVEKKLGMHIEQLNILMNLILQKQQDSSMMVLL